MEIQNFLQILPKLTINRFRQSSAIEKMAYFDPFHIVSANIITPPQLTIQFSDTNQQVGSNGI